MTGEEENRGGPWRRRRMGAREKISEKGRLFRRRAGDDREDR